MRGTNNTQYTEGSNRAIYALLDPGSNVFYCAHARGDALYNVYRQHLCGYYPKTQDWIDTMKKDEMHPCLIVLEEVSCTQVEAYNYVIVWSKILCDAGYVCLHEGNVMEYMGDLTLHNQELYDERKDTDVFALVSCNNCKLQTYKGVDCACCTAASVHDWDRYEARSKTLCIRVSDDEDRQIRHNAKLCGKTVSAYIRDIASNMVILQMDHKDNNRRTEAICGHYDSIRRLIYNIMREDHYTPADIDYIVRQTQELMRIEEEILTTQRETKNTLLDETAKIIRNNIAQEQKEGVQL